MFIILTLELIEVGAVTTALSFVHTAVSLLLHRWFPSYRGQNVSCCPSFWNNDPLNSFGDELLSGSVNFFFYLFVSFFFSITTFSVATTPHSGRFSTHRSHSIWGTGLLSVVCRVWPMLPNFDSSSSILIVDKGGLKYLASDANAVRCRVRLF